LGITVNDRNQDITVTSIYSRASFQAVDISALLDDILSVITEVVTDGQALLSSLIAISNRYPTYSAACMYSAMDEYVSTKLGAIPI
jgi:hypothetical protein